MSRVFRLTAGNKPRTCDCRDLKEIFGELVGWKEGSHEPEEFVGSFPRHQIFLSDVCTHMFLALSHTFHCFKTHLVGYISKR